MKEQQDSESVDCESKFNDNALTNTAKSISEPDILDFFSVINKSSQEGISKDEIKKIWGP